MIGKVPRGGTGFRGLVTYLMKGSKGAENPDRVTWAETRNLLTEDPAFAPRLMRATANQSKRCAKPVYHLVVSWHKDENPSDDLMRLVGDTTIEDMGLGDHQAVLAAHDDTAHRHLHIVFSRVHPETGKAWHNSNDWARLEKSMAKQAKEHGLIYVPGRHNDSDAFKATSKRARASEVRMAERRGTAPFDRWSAEEVVSRKKQLAPIFEGARSWSQLSLLLGEQGLRLAKKGPGLVISDGMGAMKLSDLGKDIRLKSLEGLYAESFETYAARAGVGVAQREDQGAREAFVPPRLIKAVEKDHPPTAKALAPVRSDSAAENCDSYQSADEPDDILTYEQKQQLRKEERERRITEREEELAERRAARAAAAAAAASDDDVNQAELTPTADVPARTTAPTNRNTDSMDDEARRKAADALSNAHQTLDLAKALGVLVSKESLEATKDDVARAKEALDGHLDLSEWVSGGVADALRAKPKAQPGSEETKKPDQKLNTDTADHDRDDDEDDYER